MRSASRNLDRGRSLARVSPWETIIGRANHSSNPPPPPTVERGLIAQCSLFTAAVLSVSRVVTCEPCTVLCSDLFPRWGSSLTQPPAGVHLTPPTRHLHCH